jgi:sporulation protein YlmC with PRC-barrel domain
MKINLLFGAVLALLGLAILPLSAQTQSTTTSSTNYITASKLIGTTVRSSQGETIGEVKDVVLDNNGCMLYTVVSTGGTGSRIVGQSKTVAVPWSVYSTTSDPRVVTVRVEKEKIYNAPVFEYSRINEYSSSGWINNVYSHYGVSASVGVSGQTSVTGSTTTTGAATTTATGSTTATTSPAVTASPIATATASPITSPAPTATASVSPMASASPSASASASPGGRGTRREPPERAASPSGKNKTSATPVSSPHHRTEMTTSEGSEGSKAEDASSPSESKKSLRRKSSEGSSTSEPSATPKTTDEQQ